VVILKTSEKFAPIQIGFGVKCTTEAAAHAARRYIHGLQHGEVVLKMDFSNASNSVHRYSIFEAVRDELPELDTLIFMCYSNSSFLNFGEHLLLSDEECNKAILLVC
jgi:hypothetical protein